MQSWGPTIPEDLGGTLFPNTNPSAVSWGPARIDLVWQEGISLVHKNYPCSGGTCCGAWTCGTNLGGSLTSSPTVASWDVNRLDVFYKTGSSTLGHKWSTNGGSSWTVEEDLGWVPNAPTAIAWGSLRLDVFSSTSLSGGQVMRRTWEPNQPWYPLVPPVGTVVVPPTNQTTEGIGPLKIWEYGATFVPNTSSNGCPTPGRGFLSGSKISLIPAARIYKTNIDCSSGVSCSNDISSSVPLPTNPSAWLESDSQLISNGSDVFLIRGLRYPVESTTALFRSGDCGNTWVRRSVISPSNYPEIRYATTTGIHGFDREEAYYEPWANRIIITMNGKGKAATNGTDDLYYYIFHSNDGGWNWQNPIKIISYDVPFYITSLPPGNIFLSWCEGITPRTTVAVLSGNTYILKPSISANFKEGGNNIECRTSANTDPPSPHPSIEPGLEGSGGISRVGRYVDDSGIWHSAVRVGYPSFENGSRKFRVVLVDYRESDWVASVSNIATISEAGNSREIIQATMVEGDPTQLGLDRGDNTALIYWRSRDLVNNNIQIKGMIFRDHLSSPSFMIDSLNYPALHNTGDFSKGGFHYNEINDTLQFWPTWIQTNTGITALRTAVVEVPR